MGNEQRKGCTCRIRDWNKTSPTPLYAYWSGIAGIAVFDDNGGSGGSAFVNTEYGQPMPDALKPYLKGYKFEGYYDANDVKYYNSDMSSARYWDKTSPETLKALWKQKSYNVILEKEGGIAGSNAVTATYDDYLPNAIAPTRIGYIFRGYYTEANGKGRQFYDAQMKSNILWDIDSHTSLYAHWELKIYYITYIYNGATYVFNPTSFTYETETFNVKQPGGTPKTGYQYEWDRSSEVRKGTTTNLTFIAVVRPIHYVLYFMHKSNLGGYPPYMGDAVAYDSDYTFTAPDPEPGYGFTAWVAWKNGTDKQPIGFTQTLTVKNLTDVTEIIYVEALYEENPCVAEGTLITLSNGSQVPVETLTGNETLLVWNLYTGSFDTAPILFIDCDAAREYKVINLRFSDGTTVKVISEHGFWDFDLNRYVYLRDDAAQYIGHWFNKQTTDNGNLAWTRVQLTGVVIATEYTTAWSPVTYSHLCYYVNGMLSMPGATESMVNIFAVNSDSMRIDEAAYTADVETYGLFTYEEFSSLFNIPEPIFEAFGGQYFKVALGKGQIDMDTLAALIRLYEKFWS